MRLQYVIVQRGEPPHGLRILSDGTLERTSAENSLPGEADRLDLDRPLIWHADRILPATALRSIEQAVRESGFFALEPRLLINYCKEDPGVGIWEIELDDQTWRVVVYDPRPRRSAAIDQIVKAIDAAIT